MNINKLIFPKPKSSYTHVNLYGNIIYIPKYQHYSINDIQNFKKYHALRNNITSPTHQNGKPRHFVFNSASSHPIHQQTPSNQFSSTLNNINPPNKSRRTTRRKKDLIHIEREEIIMDDEETEQQAINKTTRKSHSLSRISQYWRKNIQQNGKPMSMHQKPLKIDLTNHLNMTQGDNDSADLDEEGSIQEDKIQQLHSTHKIENPLCIKQAQINSPLHSKFQLSNRIHFTKQIDDHSILNTIVEENKTTDIEGKENFTNSTRFGEDTQRTPFMPSGSTSNYFYENDYIPCLYLPYEEGSTKVLIFFHGNAEDIGSAFELLNIIRIHIKIHVLAVEYPGYGIYEGKASEESIIEDAEHVYNFITKMLGVRGSDLLVFGRSIGSGPACWLASHKKIGCLMLMSPYTSIRGIAKYHLGSLAQYLINERFNNLEEIKKVKCPTFIVHGLRDRLIPHSQAQELCNAYNGKMVQLILPKLMDHNYFHIYSDFILHFMRFLECIELNPIPTIRNRGILTIPVRLFVKPMMGNRNNNSTNCDSFNNSEAKTEKKKGLLNWLFN